METQAYNTPQGYLFRIHLDTTKVLGDGSPDPAWVIEYTWSKTPPDGQTATEYLTACKREATLLAELELARRQPPTEIALP